MDIHLQNQMGFDVHAVIESPDPGEIVIRLYPKSPRRRRETLYQRLVRKNDTESFGLAFKLTAKVRWDFSALKTRVIVEDQEYEDDRVFVLKVRNGHGA